MLASSTGTFSFFFSSFISTNFNRQSFYPRSEMPSVRQRVVSRLSESWDWQSSAHNERWIQREKGPLRGVGAAQPAAPWLSGSMFACSVVTHHFVTLKSILHWRKAKCHPPAAAGSRSSKISHIYHVLNIQMLAECVCQGRQSAKLLSCSPASYRSAWSGFNHPPDKSEDSFQSWAD